MLNRAQMEMVDCSDSGLARDSTSMQKEMANRESRIEKSR
jgi:hypothetical protein